VQTYAKTVQLHLSILEQRTFELARDRRHWHAIENKSARMLPRLP
jgi:hypothetical protein